MPLPSLFGKNNSGPPPTVFDLEREQYESTSYGDGGGYQPSVADKEAARRKNPHKPKWSGSGPTGRQGTRSGFDEYDAGDDEDRRNAISKNNLPGGMRTAGMDHPRHSPPRSDTSSPISAYGDDNEPSSVNPASRSLPPPQQYQPSNMPPHKRSTSGQSSGIFGFITRKSTAESEPPMQLSGGSYSGGNAAMPGESRFDRNFQEKPVNSSGRRTMDGFGSGSSAPNNRGAQSYEGRGSSSANQPSGPLDEFDDPADKSEWGSVPSKKALEPVVAAPVKLLRSALAITGLGKEAEPEQPITYSGGSYSGGGVAMPRRVSAAVNAELKDELESGVYERRPARKGEYDAGRDEIRPKRVGVETSPVPIKPIVTEPNLLDLMGDDSWALNTTGAASALTMINFYFVGLIYFIDDDFDDFQAAPVVPVLSKPQAPRTASYPPPLSQQTMPSFQSPTANPIPQPIMNMSIVPMQPTSPSVSTPLATMAPMQPTPLRPPPVSSAAPPQTTKPGSGASNDFGDLWSLSLSPSVSKPVQPAKPSMGMGMAAQNQSGIWGSSGTNSNSHAGASATGGNGGGSVDDWLF